MPSCCWEPCRRQPPPRGLSVAELSPLLPAESGDVKAAIAVLDFILSNAAKHNVDGESLSSELQQLGLPKGGAWDVGTGPCSHTSAAGAALLCPVLQ